MLTLSSAFARKKGEVPSFFGVMLFLVITDSMEPDISPGDFIVASKINTEKIVVGNDIVFYSAEPTLKGMIIVHRVIRIESSPDGDKLFYTQGINTLEPDRYPTSEVLGIYRGKSKVLGQAVRLFRKRTGIFIFGSVVLFLLVAAGQIKKITEELNRAKLEKEYSLKEAENAKSKDQQENIENDESESLQETKKDRLDNQVQSSDLPREPEKTQQDLIE